MNQNAFHKGKFADIQSFPHIVEFFRKKNQHVQPGSLLPKVNSGLRINFVSEGKFEWSIDDESFVVFPNDAVIIFPNQTFASPKDIWDVGMVCSLMIQLDFYSEDGEFVLGDWSGIPNAEQRLIAKLFSINQKPVIQNCKLIGEILQKIELELSIGELGFKTRVNQLLDELIISTARQLSKQDNQRRDFPQTFQKLDKILRENLAHPWTVEEMAMIMGLGTTAFTEKVKSYSGFSPLNYLINLRIAESIRFLKNTKISLTDIALDTGFYSSQHFSTTFKRLTGYTPGYFRKNN